MPRATSTDMTHEDRPQTTDDEPAAGYRSERHGRGQSGYAAGYRGEPRDRSNEAMGYGGYGRDDRYPAGGRPGYGGCSYGDVLRDSPQGASAAAQHTPPSIPVATRPSSRSPPSQAI